MGVATIVGLVSALACAFGGVAGLATPSGGLAVVGALSCVAGWLLVVTTGDGCGSLRFKTINVMANTQPVSSRPSNTLLNVEPAGAAWVSGRRSNRDFRRARNSGGGSFRMSRRKVSFIAALQSPSTSQRLH